MAEIRIGTSGYDYRDWKDVFYPSGLDRADFLAHYSQNFTTVELNFSYYRIPTAKQLKGIQERAGRVLDFSIKAHESLTHKIDPASWKDSAHAFQEALTPLLGTDRLSAVLLQFPYSFHYVPENRRYLDQLLAEMRGLPLVAEFRGADWLNDRVLDSLRERGVGYCSVDAPPLKGLPPSLDVVTSSLAYIRFHGRNVKNWWGSDSASRYDYLYKEDELKGWIARIKSMAQSAQKVRIYFNNHFQGQAPANAMLLKRLLSHEGIPGLF